MNYLKISLIITTILTTLSSCNAFISDSEVLENENISDVKIKNLVSENKKTIYTKFKTPELFQRVKPVNEFAKFLNNLPLKSDKLNVKLYDGTDKINTSVYVGILDLTLSDKNIQFNANAIYRLRAEYLYRTKQYDKIDFKFNKRQDLLSFTEYTNGDFSQAKFNEYLEYFLTHITPNSLTHYMHNVAIKEIQIGDVFVQKSQNKGHAVIVMDIAKNNAGEKIFLLAQSYYPSQDIHIITNPSNDEISPWYLAKEGVILTPEWRFMSTDLMRFN